MASASLYKNATIRPNTNSDFQIIKSDDLYIGGYASIELVDKQNDLITLEALNDAVKKFMVAPKYRNVMNNHSNVQVGEVVKEYRDKSGKLWKTDVDDVGFFVVIKLRDDIEKAKEVSRDIRKGTLRSFSIGGQALEKRKRENDELGKFNEISKLELHEVTICEKGINPEAKFDILKQDKGDDMTNVAKALEELNSLLKDIRGENVSKAPNPKSMDEEGFELQELPEGEEKMTSEYLDTEEETEDLPADDLELAHGEEEDDMEMASSDEETELKSKTSHTHETQLVDEAGLEVVSGGQPKSKHAQRGDMGIPAGTETKKSIYSGNTPTLDLSAENLEKAYAEFKAEQMEKMAYNDIKAGFQKRFESEVNVKKEAIAKANYDPRSEVNELKKQFSELIDTLKGEKENVIRKQQEAVDNLNVPSGDEIAKMDWNEVHLAMARLERNFR
jgi:HK97 family phage prohead protease